MPRKKEYWKYREKVLQKHKEYVSKNRQKVKSYYRNWYKKNGRNRAIDYVEAIIDWQNKHPEGRKAHRELQYAVKTGKIKKPKKCSECHEIKKLSAHHEDYSKPLAVLWLCSSCHKLKHSA